MMLCLKSEHTDNNVTPMKTNPPRRLVNHPWYKAEKSKFIVTLQNGQITVKDKTKGLMQNHSHIDA